MESEDDTSVDSAYDGDSVSEDSGGDGEAQLVGGGVFVDAAMDAISDGETCCVTCGESCAANRI